MAPDGPQGGLEAVEGILVAAHHYGKGAGGGPVNPAADRRVEEGDPLFRACVVEASHHRRGVGGEVENHLAANGAFQYSVFPQDHRLDVPGNGQGR